MTTRVWLGRAKPVAHLETITVGGTIAPGDTFSVTINGKSITFTATTTTIAHVVAGLVALLNDDDAPAEFAELTWADSSPTLTGTGDTEGVPFTITVAKASAAGTISTTTTTAATGPNYWSDANNWSGGAVPVNADDVVLDNPVSILYGLAQSAVTLTSLTITEMFDSQSYIGLPRENSLGYTEYRDTYLAVGATTVTIATNSGRIKIDFGTVQTAVEVRQTGRSSETNTPALILKGTHASNALDVLDGSVGVAVFGGEVSTIATLRTATGADVSLGSGVTLTTVTGMGNVKIRGAVTTINQTDGEVVIEGAGAVTTLAQRGGTCYYRTSGTLTTATIAGTVDCSQDMSGRTFTTTTLSAGGRILDPHKTITYTNAVALGADVREVSAA